MKRKNNFDHEKVFKNGFESELWSQESRFQISEVTFLRICDYFLVVKIIFSFQQLLIQILLFAFAKKLGFETFLKRFLEQKTKVYRYFCHHTVRGVPKKLYCTFSKETNKIGYRGVPCGDKTTYTLLFFAREIASKTFSKPNFFAKATKSI